MLYSLGMDSSQTKAGEGVSATTRYPSGLNESLVRDIVRTARVDPSSLRFKFYAREMQHVLETNLLSDAIRETLTAAIRDETRHGHGEEGK